MTDPGARRAPDPVAADSFTPDRQTYIRAHVRLAAVFMAAALAVLWLTGNPDPWIGPVAALIAIALRGWYLYSEDIAAIWRIEDGALTGPQERRIPLDQIATVRTLGSFVQVVTRGGDKHLIKYMPDPAAARDRIAARAGIAA